jgi:hypothetical protein
VLLRASRGGVEHFLRLLCVCLRVVTFMRLCGPDDLDDRVLDMSSFISTFECESGLSIDDLEASRSIIYFISTSHCLMKYRPFKPQLV